MNVHRLLLIVLLAISPACIVRAESPQANGLEPWTRTRTRRTWRNGMLSWSPAQGQSVADAVEADRGHARHPRAEVWMAIIRGATGIGYFTHRWVPSYTQFAPKEPMTSALRRLNERLARLAPAFLAEPARVKITMTLGDGLSCHFKATLYNGDL